MRASKRHFFALFAIAIFAFGALLGLPYLFSNMFLPENSSSASWLFWTQTLAGNWPGDYSVVSTGTVSPWGFGFAATIATLLNNFLFFVIVGLIWQIFVERKRNMEMADALILRDFLIKESFKDLFDKASEKRSTPLDSSHASSILSAAFQDGTSSLEKHLINTYGTAEAKSIIGTMKVEGRRFQQA